MLLIKEAKIKCLISNVDIRKATLLHICYFESTKFYSSSHITYLMRLQPARYPSMAPFQWDLCGSDQWSKRLVGLGALAFKSKGWPEGLSPKVQNCKKVNIIIELECWRLAGPKHLFGSLEYPFILYLFTLWKIRCKSLSVCYFFQKEVLSKKT